MTYRKRFYGISLHQRYYSNPLNPINPLWKYYLMMYSFKNTKRNSPRSKYNKMRRVSNHIRYLKNNPCTWILEDKNERKVWGKF